MRKDSNRDYIGMWFRARARHGIDDTIRFGVIDPNRGEVEWQGLPHARFDAIGGLAHILRERGVEPAPLPASRETRAPGWFRLIRRAANDEPVSAPGWRGADGPRPEQPRLAVDWVSPTETGIIRRNAREHGVSVTVLLLWALHQVVTHHLVTQQRGRWFFPVNMRGPVRLPSDEMNHASGFYLGLDADWTPEAVRERIGAALRAQRHWRMWRQARVGRLVGQRGVDWLYDRLARDDGCLGSFSWLGEWEQDMTRAGWPAASLVCFSGPGSPAHPVSNGSLIWNGRLTLVLQFHPVLGFSQALLEQCLRDWRHLLVSGHAPGVAA